VAGGGVFGSHCGAHHRLGGTERFTPSSKIGPGCGLSGVMAMNYPTANAVLCNGLVKEFNDGSQTLQVLRSIDTHFASGQLSLLVGPSFLVVTGIRTFSAHPPKSEL